MDVYSYRDRTITGVTHLVLRTNQAMKNTTPLPLTNNLPLKMKITLFQDQRVKLKINPVKLTHLLLHQKSRNYHLDMRVNVQYLKASKRLCLANHRVTQTVHRPPTISRKLLSNHWSHRVNHTDGTLLLCSHKDSSSSTQGITLEYLHNLSCMTCTATGTCSNDPVTQWNNGIPT